MNLQQYAQQAALQVMEKKSANQVSVIIMNPQNGEILSMVTVPEFNLNDPFTLPAGAPPADPDKKQELLNQMWRNPCINDTYEPGSTFKIITAAAGWRRESLRSRTPFPVRASGLWRIGESGATRREDTEGRPSFRDDEFLQSCAY